MNAVISAARMIPFRANAPKNDLVDAWAISFGSMMLSGLVVDLVRHTVMSGCTITQEKTGTLGL